MRMFARRSCSLRAAATLVAILVGGGLAAAQAPTGTISGAIVDESDQVIPGATVELINEQTGASRTGTTGPDGRFSFQAVPAGAYTVKIVLEGFRAFESKNNVVNAGSHLALDKVVLAVGVVTEVLTVEASGTPVESKSTEHSGLLTSTQLSLIQTKGRDVMSLLRLLPGVRYEGDIEAMGDSFGSLVPQIGGQRRHWNAIMVDGLLGNETSGTNRFSSAINLDAIAEVKVLLNTYQAEYGRTGGANIQIVSKSGGTNYHGSAYYYGRRDAWNANRWENNRAGLPKPKYVFDTYGFNLGGPAAVPGLWKQDGDRKLLFFYSLEAPQVRNPGPVRRYLMPTELERRGDFSQTFDQAGRLIVIRDPLTGQPFSGNVIPGNRIDPNTRAILNRLPMPNDPGSRGQFNFVRQETPDNPRWNNVVRLDWKHSADSSFFGTLRTFNSNQYGSEITAGPPDWGFFDASYIFSDNGVTAGWTKIFGSNKVNELSGGVKWQTEGFPPRSDAEYSQLRRADVGWNYSQWYPELNTLDLMPRFTFGLAIAGAQIESPDFTWDNRIGNTAIDQVYSIRDTFTWVKGNHTLKSGGYFEFMQNREARGGNWMGEYQFQRDTANPLDTGHAFSNALLGVFRQYTETDRYGSSFNRGILSEWFLQDTWRPTNSLTVDYGARFLYYTPWWRPDELTANFRPELYDPASAPRLYQPAVINGVRVAFDPPTGQRLNQIYIGAFVPGTGDPSNGMELATDPDAPRGHREQRAPEIEPRVGVAYDLFGRGTTVLHASAGMFHNARLGGGNLGNLRNPPFFNNPIAFYGSASQLFQPGAAILLFPTNINALERDAHTPSSYNWSAGIRQDIGWGTVVDVTYAGSAGRHLEMEYNINAVPDGARFLDQHPENRDPTRPTTPLPPAFLRPYRGYQDIIVRANWGTSDYHSVQIQANRRYIRGVQFGANYTWARAKGLGDEDPARIALNRPLESWHYGIAGYNQDHSLVVNYMWDLPDASGRWNNAFARLALDGWQLSGENAFVSGDWAQVFLTSVPAFDFTGGDGGDGGNLGGNSVAGTGGADNGLRAVRPNLIGDPMAGDRDPLTGWFNTAAFARPARGEYGDAPRTPIQKPGVINWNLAVFKNFGLGGSRGLQYRLEVYNVLNTAQFDDVDRSAQFDSTGRQVNANFGIATRTRPPRVMQMSIRFTF
jgi:Carboxypeptidase regulatory-like domain/TonB-dependent Receptor Plug Domain